VAAAPPYPRSQGAVLMDTRLQPTDGANSGIPACRFWDTEANDPEHAPLDAGHAICAWLFRTLQRLRDAKFVNAISPPILSAFKWG
jgi:hypothetical protein